MVLRDECVSTNSTCHWVRLLQQLCLVSCATRIAESLKLNTTVTTIDFGCECASPTAIESSIVHVRVAAPGSDGGANSIGDAGASALAEALKVNTLLASIGFGGGERRIRAHGRP
jgi:hypothetical protein